MIESQLCVSWQTRRLSDSYLHGRLSVLAGRQIDLLIRLLLFWSARMRRRRTLITTWRLFATSTDTRLLLLVNNEKDEMKFGLCSLLHTKMDNPISLLEGCCCINWQTASPRAHLLVSFSGPLSGTLRCHRLAMGARVRSLSFGAFSRRAVEQLGPQAICARSNLVLHRGERHQQGRFHAFIRSLARPLHQRRHT